MDSKISVFKNVWEFKKALKINPKLNGVSQPFLDAKDMALDELMLDNCEGCWNSNYLTECKNLIYCTNCLDCHNSTLLVNCDNCKNCNECENLIGANGHYKENGNTKISHTSDKINLTLLIIATIIVGVLITLIFNT